MGNGTDFINNIFNTYKNTASYKDNSMMEYMMRKGEFEKNLDDMWANYMRGCISQITSYQEQVNGIKGVGLKVLRNSEGKHKIMNK